jgi:uncharacterized membrane protein
MHTPLLLASIHLLALAVGLAGVWTRARALRETLRDAEDPRALRRAIVGGSWWGVAIVLWLTTGLWQLLGSTGASASHGFTAAFLAKAALVVAIVVLEVWPLRTLVLWRLKRTVPEPVDAGRVEVISYVQCALVVAIVVVSVRMAHGASFVPVAPDARVVSGDSAAIAGGHGVATEPGVVPPITPSGSETVTPEDLAMLAREIAMPLDGVDPATLRSNFDERRGGGARQHRALDMMASRGTPVKSATKGRVLKLFTSAAGGLMVYAADSSERFVMMYAHLDGYAPGMRDGVAVERGQVIGYVGFTGNAIASAPHLHFAVARSADVRRWSKGKPIDPVPVLQSATRD